MSSDEAMDFYEILEVSPNASQETISRMFRFWASRYHPDRPSGDAIKFALIVKAHETLRDSEKRAAYDVRFKRQSAFQSHMVEEAGSVEGFTNDAAIQESILSLMYVKRKRDIHKAGCSNYDLERLTGCPRELLDFHLWYLREKGWVMRTEDGTMAISADGVDKTLAERRKGEKNKLLTNHGSDAGAKAS